MGSSRSASTESRPYPHSMNRPPTAVLVVVSGLPGSGKSALADALAAHLGAVHLSIDVAEEAMLAVGLAHDWTTGVAAYEAAGALASLNLGLGSVVVVDAVNDSEAARSTWRSAAGRAAADLRFLVTVCSDEDEHRRRLAMRSRPFLNVREPTWEDVQRRAAKYEPWLEPHTVIDTLQPLSRSLAQAVLALRTSDE